MVKRTAIYDAGKVEQKTEGALRGLEKEGCICAESAMKAAP
jgi:hypothetical protein